VHVVHTLTREVDDRRFGPKVRKGRINPALLSELIPEPSTCLVYACGPAITPFERVEARQKGVPPEPRFLENVLGQLNELGVKPNQIKRESYG
jgi:hypothetical protein